ncbi:pentapeptide repeat-containing protein [Anabaena azotica]|uniref:Pentapeptide repeat-containing protein n=1 Tax=Anabaena azotica FACHB-119 TaxID=947527 RepID=A0ABR8DCM4_9NOST|nr:pentapeptide repeat-containing protein [Anabaena azotica]MBD2504864.1 pentapeptide repeat-containing protein [Anabaena azotica FACHB-119]
MANKEHLAIFEKGIDYWNRWRRENPSIRPDLSEALINDFDFSGINFSQVDLSGAKLIDAVFNNTNFSQAYLSETNFSRSILMGANLSRTILNEAILNKSDFTGSNFQWAYMVRTRALDTNFSGANLTGVCIEDWHINSSTQLDGVICNYVYRRQKKRERYPSSGNFAPGEFAKLFQKSLETVDLIFRNGIDWDAFAYSFKKLEVENQGGQLDVQSIEKKGDGVLLVRVAVAPDADKAKIYNDFMQGYEFAAKTLEAQYQARLEDKDKVIVRQEAQINRLFDIVEQQGSVQKALAENPRKVSNTNIINSQLASGLVDAINVESQQIGGNIHNNNA